MNFPKPQSTIRLKMKQSIEQDKRPINLISQGFYLKGSYGSLPQVRQRFNSTQFPPEQKFKKTITVNQKQQQNKQSTVAGFDKLYEKLLKRQLKTEKHLIKISQSIDRLVNLMANKLVEQPETRQRITESKTASQKFIHALLDKQLSPKEGKKLQKHPNRNFIQIDSEQTYEQSGKMHLYPNQRQNTLNYAPQFDINDYSSEYEARMKNINVRLPQKNSSLNEVLIWVGEVCKRVLSVGFKLYINGQLTINKTKSFCSQNIIRNLINLPKEIKQKYWQSIDNCMKNELFPYYRFNYPQAQEKGVSNKLSHLLIQRDTLNKNENDMCHKSGVNFELEADQNYNSQIMRFLNFIISLTNMLPGLKQNKNNENTTLGKLFVKDFQKIFQFIEDKENITGIDSFQPSRQQNIQIKNQHVLDYIERNFTDPNSQNENEYRNKNKYSDIEQNKQNEEIRYKEKVKSYTSQQIGQKISQDFPLFSEYKIQSGNLELNNSALMRVITKWCSELQWCFIPKQILGRQIPWKMKDGSEKYLKKSQMIALNSLLQREKDKINKKLDQIRHNNYQNQKEFSNRQVDQELKKFTEQQAVVGQFCSSTFKVNQSALIKYLNMLIHGINLALSDFQKLQRVDKVYGNIFNNFLEEQNNEINKKQLKHQLGYVQNKIKTQGITTQLLVKTPQLIMFKIGDLLRSKCSSKQYEITALYKFIEYLSHTRPELIKILRVKNKLHQGTQDILINILYRQSMIIQLQLGIKSEKTKFSQYSNKFNHYFYELERSKFGPIMEMCSIWISQDQRSKFYLNKINQNNKRVRNKKPKQCCINSQNLDIMSLPFRCQTCSYTYYECNFYQKHSKCKQCRSLVCCLCRFEQADIKNKLEIFPVLKQDTRLIQDNLITCQKLPMEGGKMFNINSKMKRIKMFKPVIYNNQCHIFSYEQESRQKKLYVIQKYRFQVKQYESEQKKQEERKKQLQKWFDVFSLSNPMFHSSQVELQYKDLNKELAEKIYFIPKGFEEMKKLKKQSIALIKKNVSSDTIKLIRAEIKSAQRVNFSENKILELKTISQKFPNVEMAVLSNNKFNSLTTDDVSNWGNYIAYLYLNRNQIQNISGIGCLTKLVQLNLEYNAITEIPEKALQNLNQLRYLDLQENKLTSLPKTIKYLTKLNSLDLSTNRLTYLPKQIGELQSLSRLKVSENLLTDLPEQIGRLRNLKLLQLSSNKLKEVPNNLGKLINLQVLDLSWNQLIQLPQYFGKLYNLKKLDLKYNKLVQLPLSFIYLSNIRVLDLKNNRLTCLSQEFGKLTTLTSLDLKNNHIVWLPKQIGSLHNLLFLDLKNNKLTQLPKQFGNLHNLTKLDISCNLIQKLPKQFQNLSDLRTLDMQFNQMQQISHEFCNLRSLSVLIASNNKIKILPTQFGNLFSLTLVDMSNNQISQLPYSFINLNNLKTLYICSNSLTALPPKFQNLKNIIQIDISNNKFEGLPLSLIGLVSLQKLQCTFSSAQQLRKKLQKWPNLKELIISSSIQKKQSPNIMEMRQICKLHKIQFKHNQGQSSSMKNMDIIDKILKKNI